MAGKTFDKSRKLCKRGSSPFSRGGSAESLFSFGSTYNLDQAFGSPTREDLKATRDENSDSINVVVRVRPLNTKESKAHDANVVSFPGNGQILVEGLSSITGNSGPKSKLFSFNVVFEPGSTQEDVLHFSGIKKLIAMAVEGFNTTCFCYGQTGSGKTHTLTGPPGMVIDLLNPGSSRKPLAVRWSKKSRNFFVENLFTVDCEELDDLQAVLEEGMKNRSVGCHSMNEYSSRSHTILTVHITSEQQMADSGVFITKQGKINFVDLAGSEMTKKTNSIGKTLEEANNINKSLMVLGYCIASLSDPKRRSGHIPYRDSKLTKLLADSLAGSGVTLMIACISPALSNATETLNTLRYAARAKRIRTKPIVVMDPREAMIVSLKREIAALENENQHLRLALDLSRKSAAERPWPSLPPHVDLEKIARMEGAELVDLIKHYSVENEALRKENADLFNSRDMLVRDHEIVCRENERLLKKLEDVNLACIRSPIIKSRRNYSSDGKITGNDDSYKELPLSIQKEINKRGMSNKSPIGPTKNDKNISRRCPTSSFANIFGSLMHSSQLEPEAYDQNGVNKKRP